MAAPFRSAYSAFMAPMLTSRATTLSLSSPVTGRPLSSWKRRMASLVAWLAGHRR